MHRLVALGLVAAACASSTAPPLAPAGTLGDDGAGELARQSVRLEFAGADEVRSPGTGWVSPEPAYDPLADFGGFGYGGYGYGGDSYGGIFGSRLGLGWSPPLPAPPSTFEVRAVGDPATIEGTVQWSASGGVAWPAGCPAARTAVRGQPVVGAIAYLEQVTVGRAELPTATGTVTANRCALWPPVQIIGAAPTVVTLENRRATAARVTPTVDNPQVLEVEPGGRLDLPIDLNRAVGFYDPELVPAWVVPATHPYYTVVDDAGRFLLDEVPPGAHTLVIWYPPMAVAVGASGPTWSAPAIVRRPIVVGPNATISVAIAVTPATTAAAPPR